MLLPTALNWPEQGFIGRKPRPESAVYSLLRDCIKFRRLNHAHSSAKDLDPASGCFVSTLLRLRGPNTVFFIVPLVVILSFECQSGRASTHVSEERSEASRPFIANSDTSTAIPLVVMARSVFASPPHLNPNLVLPGLRHSVGRIGVRYPSFRIPFGGAPAGPCGPSRYSLCTGSMPLRATVAITNGELSVAGHNDHFPKPHPRTHHNSLLARGGKPFPSQTAARKGEPVSQCGPSGRCSSTTIADAKNLTAFLAHNKKTFVPSFV